MAGRWSLRVPGRIAAVAAGGVAALALAAGASASIAVATGSFSQPRLAVDASGKARVTWIEDGARRTLFVPPSGQVTYTGLLNGPDVSRPTSVAGLPLALVTRRTPDGMLWALQRWALAGRRPELHLARWRGQPTALSLSVSGSRLRGTALFHGRPVTAFSTTPAGRRMRTYVYLECFGCEARPDGWMPMLGVTPRGDGSFSAWLRPAWQGERYRASLAGPNVGTVRGPDAQVVVGAG